MAFEFYRAENSAAPIEKELPATVSESYKHGEAVKFNSGALTKSGATEKPEFVYVGKDITSAITGQIINVVPVLPEYEWETTLSAAGTSLVPGNKVTVSSDGTEATATTGSGVFELLTDGGAKGAKVVGRF